MTINLRNNPHLDYELFEVSKVRGISYLYVTKKDDRIVFNENMGIAGTNTGVVLFRKENLFIIGEV